MIKKIAVGDLIPGMYVHDLNCGWMDHPFLSSRFLIKNEGMAEKIRRLGIKELYIDSSRGADAPRAQSAVEVRSELRRELDRVVEEVQPVQRVTLREELEAARRVHAEARETVTRVMQDVRLGRQLEVARVEPVVGEMVESIFRNQEALLGLGRIRQGDHYTFQHSVSVAVLMITFAKSLELDRDTIHQIGIGALLHDVGKIMTPQEILTKPGRLSDAEFEIMKGHVRHSGTVLEASGGIHPAAIQVAVQHHERYDGSGYPHGLKGDEISLAGHMAGIVDVYDAISSDRCYRRGEEPTAVLGKLLEWSKFHFHRELTQRFIQCVGIYPVGTLVRLESGRLAVVLEPGEKSLLHPIVRVVYDTTRARHLKPLDLDLANPSPQTGDDRIVGYESPDRWGLQPHAFFDAPQTASAG